MISVICAEGAFPEGTKMIVVFGPIAPSPDEVVAGEIISPDADIELNSGRESIEITVVNSGDRDIQVRSHAHFFETNRALEFDRASAFGMRLDTPSGVGVRFEPGITKIVRLVAFGGARRALGFGGLTNGLLDNSEGRAAALNSAQVRGYRGA